MPDLTRLPAHAALLALTVLLDACGGGSTGGSVASTPSAPSVTALTASPPAVTPVNATLTAPLKSENFNTLAVKVSETGGAKVTGSYSSGPLQISYDSASNTYTFLDSTVISGAEGNIFKFKPSANDSAEANLELFGFCQKGGDCPVTRVLVSHTGGSGFSYTYSALAKWEYGGGTSDVSRETLHFGVFGATTQASAVPTTGSAIYSLDLLGTEYVPSSVFQTNGNTLKGTGTGTFNFGNGTFSLSGSMSAPMTGNAATTGFSGSGKIASGANGFTGSFTFSDQGQFNGALAGWFFGPAAQELGAVFGATASDGRVAAGAILGHH